MTTDLLHGRAGLAALCQECERAAFAAGEGCDGLRLFAGQSPLGHAERHSEMCGELLEFGFGEACGEAGLGHASYTAAPLLYQMELAEKPCQHAVAGPGNTSFDVLDGGARGQQSGIFNL